MKGLPQADRWRRRLSGHGLTARDVPKSLQPSPQPEGQHAQRDAEHQRIRAICPELFEVSSHRAQAKGKRDPRAAVEN